ncbi:MAG TPA: D-glycerate dehydrogenase [Tepidiformaceae bacterium]|nr:D-glycerate dehydrogenase [Tepidiformaceae bacterium]
MARVFVTRQVPGNAIPMLERAGHEVQVWAADGPIPPDELLLRAQDCDAVLAMLTDRFDATAFRNLPRLRVVANMAVGYDNIDVAAATAAGVWATNTPGVLAETTADLAFGLMLAAARNIVTGERAVRAGEWGPWSPTGYLGVDVHGATLGIVGLGEIGMAMARRASGFGMRILYASRSEKSPPAGVQVERKDLQDLLAESDFVSLHVPLSAETRHLIGRDELRSMKRTAILVNSARGGVVDQAALVEALHDGAIAGAALDVADPEPVRPGDPLLDAPNVVITPHIASASIATRSRMAELAAQNIVAVLAGREPLTPVNHVERPRV